MRETLKQLQHEDVVLFDNKKQLQEYINLSGDDTIFPIEINGIFPRIQSKFWSFECSFNNGSHFDVKQTALTRLISWNEYKRRFANHENGKEINGQLITD
jgi:hypothetical protein